tara:strand:+ start:326 stop:655 length:330 start_codon:yes stop_codon:yes gene_type:complete
MNSLTIKGSLKKKLEPETISGKEGKIWKKQNFIINTGAQFNAEICFQLFGEERIQILERFNINDTIEVFFNLYSKKFNDRYFHNIDAWKIEKAINENKESEITQEENPF